MSVCSQSFHVSESVAKRLFPHVRITKCAAFTVMSNGV